MQLDSVDCWNDFRPLFRLTALILYVSLKQDVVRLTTSYFLNSLIYYRATKHSTSSKEGYLPMKPCQRNLCFFLNMSHRSRNQQKKHYVGGMPMAIETRKLSLGQVQASGKATLVFFFHWLASIAWKFLYDICFKLLFFFHSKCMYLFIHGGLRNSHRSIFSRSKLSCFPF